MIIVDTREQDEEESYFIRNGIDFRRETLSCGDYAAEDSNGNRVVIERKEMSDLIQSMFEGRLESQLRRLSLERLPILVITGTIEDYWKRKQDSKFTRDHLYGIISSAIVRYGLRCVIWCRTNDEGLGIIHKLLIKITENKLDKIPNRRTKEYSTCVGYLRSLLNCTQDTALELLKRFKNIHGIINASDKELLEAEGIGPKKVERLRKIIDG